MNPRIRNQIRLKFAQIHIQCSIEPERGSQRRYDLGSDPIEVCVGWPLDVKIALADVIKGFIVEQHAEAALKISDRAVILDTGEVAFEGTAKEVLDNEELMHKYLAI